MSNVNDTSINNKHFQILTLYSEAHTERLAQQLAALVSSGSVWLSGDLGAGKTTLTRYWLQAIGHKGAVKSPTYTLIEPYSIEQDNKPNKLVYHTDLYRIEDPEELSLIGFDEYLDDPNALVIIEWPSRADSYLPPPTLFIDITQGVDDSRQVELQLSKVGQAQGLDLSLIKV
ncbi:tRNA (adenosine(37)-N6)-threonylcarbamoyltransferase complex ATPase subunit type 1 TsaE [uncultured Psychrobacter sp.]|uniref:tRNA (adenosine(37)-N6)-threonylcarbamoyltransferase complex ATPase subunit type 1 TsaE n=1 Tax=uncultured Psychrobacter sp. TaxID=259303 RepID=UPI0034588D9D